MTDADHWVRDMLIFFVILLALIALLTYLP